MHWGWYTLQTPLGPHKFFSTFLLANKVFLDIYVLFLLKKCTPLYFRFIQNNTKFPFPPSPLDQKCQALHPKECLSAALICIASGDVWFSLNETGAEATAPAKVVILFARFKHSSRFSNHQQTIYLSSSSRLYLTQILNSHSIPFIDTEIISVHTPYLNIQHHWLFIYEKTAFLLKRKLKITIELFYILTQNFFY